MPYVAYKLIHFLAIFTVIGALTATSMHALGGGTRAANPLSRAFSVAHGVAAFLILLGGFGMLARLGVVHTGLPAWVYLKLVLWVLISAAMVLPYRGRAWAAGTIIAAPVLAVLGAAIALFKPFG